MRNKLKKTLAVLASVSMCSSTLLQFPSGTFNLTLPVSAAEGDVEISETNFPDEAFRTYVDENFDTTDDNVLDADEIAAVTWIDLYTERITTVADLTGVEYFTALESLDCSYNQLTSLDVSNCTALKYLWCSNNQLTSLDVSNNTALKKLSCFSNQLLNLGVSNNTALEQLYCYSNKLTSLDVSKNTALERMYCSYNQLTSLDVSKNTALTNLDCSDNQLTSLDVSNNTALNLLYCFSNQLTSLDVSKNTALKYLCCESNKLESLDVSNCSALEYLYCYNNPLLSLNGVSDSVTTFSGSPLYAFLTTDDSVSLSEYGIVEANVSDLTGGEIKDGAIVPTTFPGTVTYTYDAGSDKTISCTIKFGIAINEENFPDAVFREYVDTNFDTTDDDFLDAEEIAAVTRIDFWSADITTVADLTGVEYFTALEYLFCSYNQLESLDVSNCSALTELYCYDNQLESLDVSGCTALTYLYCYYNYLESLDVSNCSALEDLDCYDNQLESLDVSKNTALKLLYCDSNQLTSLDVSKNTALEELICDANKLESLDVSNCSALEELDCHYNPLLSLNGVSSSVTSFTGSPLDAFLTTDDSVSLSEYGIVETNISNFIGGEIKDGAIVPTTFPGTVTYTYDAGSDKTISCIIKFGIPINEENFPDAVFREYVDDNFDTTDDDFLDAEEIAAVTKIDFDDEGITTVADLTGVEYFTALEYLDCYDNQLESLDVSNCSALTELYCDSNQLESLDVSNCSALTELYCNSNQLKSLDVSKNTALKYLYCNSNQLKSLDVSKNTALEYLVCYSNQLTSLDVSNCSELTWLNCHGNQLKSLDVSNCSALNWLYCYNNPLLSLNGVNSSVTDFNGSPLSAFLTTDESVSLSEYGIVEANVSDLTGGEIKDGAIVPTTFPGTVTYTYDAGSDKTISCTIKFGIPINEENFPDAVFREYVDDNIDTTDDDFLDAEEIAKVAEIDVSNKGISDLTGVEYFTALESLNCGSNQLTSLDVSNCTTLKYLWCSDNQLTSLDVSNCSALIYLICYSNQLTSLDVSKNTALKRVYCYSNQLESLDISDCTALDWLLCDDNQLTSLDVSNCTALQYLYCYKNPLLSLKGVSNSVTTFKGSPLYAVLTTDASVSLSEYDIVEANVSDLTGGEIKDGAIVPTTFPGTVTYTYDAGSDKTISCTIKFGIAINETNFPDDVFRSYVNEDFDTTDDDFLDAEEIAAVTEINVAEMGISDLTGIEYFTALKYLFCYSNKLESLDVSQNTALTYLSCDSNQLTSLDVSNCTALTDLDCSENQLTSLDVSKNTALTDLNCSDNQLTSLDVSNNTALNLLYCFSNQLTSLDVSKNTALEYLSCNSNQLTSLDVSNCSALTWLKCNSNQLTSLDVSKNTALEYLICNSNQLTSLDVSNCSALTWLYCNSNQLTSLDVSNCAALTELDCYNNPLLSLNCVNSSLTYFNGSPLYAVLTTDASVSLSEYDIVEANVSDLTGGEIKDGAIVPATFPGTVTYTYDSDGENGDKTISCTIKFGVPIDETNFPDEIFRTYVDENFDTTDDNVLTADEIAAVTKISVSDKGISDLTGIEYFTALKSLDCSSNKLESLDVSKNTALTHLYCFGNQLTALDVSNCAALAELFCNSNQLTSLDLSNNTELINLYCDSNELTSLDVSNCTKLIDLNCDSNYLTSLEVGNCTALKQLTCHSNEITDLDMSNCAALTYLVCYTNKLTSLDVNNCAALKTLYCDSNYLTSLEVGNCTELKDLNCSSNQLTSLDVSQNAALETLYCESNSYEIDLIGGKFDLSALPEGFDVTKASEWTNASVEDGVLTVSDPMDKITYIYDLGNGSAETFTLIPVSCTITEDMIQGIGEYTYTGEPIEPVVVKCGDTELVEDIDYTISYENNVDVGTASAVIKSTGDFYNGEVTLEFTILPDNVEILGMYLTNSLTLQRRRADAAL